MTLRFKLDENLPRRVEPALHGLGHDVETAISENLAGAVDPDLLAACTVEDRILITLDLDFADAETVFEGVTLEIQDSRKEYGEERIICYGMLAGRMVVIGYAPRGADRHVFSMRKANEREKTRIAPLLKI